MGVCIRAILSLEAHNSGGRSCLLCRGGDHSTVGNRSGTRDRFLFPRRWEESDGVRGRRRVRLGRESLVFKAAARLRVALPLEEPVIMFSIRSPLPGGGWPTFVQPFELSNLELQSDRPAHAHTWTERFISTWKTDRLGKRVKFPFVPAFR